MAIRLDLNELFHSTSPLDYNSPYAVSFWFRLHSLATGGDQTLFELFLDNSNFDRISLQDSNNRFVVTAMSGGASTTGQYTTALVVNVWYHVLMGRSSTTSLSGFIFGNGGTGAPSSSQSVAGRAAASGMSCGATWRDPEITFPADVSICAMKLLTGSANVALARVESFERQHAIPRWWEFVQGWWPFVRGFTQFTDLSGKGRTWTQVGTIGETDNPPIGWEPTYSTALATTADAVAVPEPGFLADSVRRQSRRRLVRM